MIVSYKNGLILKKNLYNVIRHHIFIYTKGKLGISVMGFTCIDNCCYN